MAQDNGRLARIIWLSDLHFETQGLVLGHDPRLRLEAAIDHINAHYDTADICVISGDMVETATDANYHDLHQRLDRLVIPWLPMTGNHDQRELFLKHLPVPDNVMPGFVQYAQCVGSVRLICLDTLWDGQDAGLLCPGRLDWLEAELRADTDSPAVIFMHHPPVTLGLPMLDADRLSTPDRFLKLITAHPNVKQLCCGHVHRPVQRVWRGICITTIRSVLYQAPPALPDWGWDSFQPAPEAPDLGVIDISTDGVTIQFAEFCAAEYGVEETQSN